MGVQIEVFIGHLNLSFSLKINKNSGESSGPGSSLPSGTGRGPGCRASGPPGTGSSLLLVPPSVLAQTLLPGVQDLPISGCLCRDFKNKSWLHGLSFQSVPPLRCRGVCALGPALLQGGSSAWAPRPITSLSLSRRTRHTHCFHKAQSDESFREVDGDGEIKYKGSQRKR